MIVIKKSGFTGIVHKRDIKNLTPRRLVAWVLDAGLIQNIMPDVSVEDREFLIFGITPEEWNDFFGEEGNEY